MNDEEEELFCDSPNGLVYRVGFEPNAWAWPPWEFAPADGKWDGRWDDPEGMYRVIYAGSTAEACFIEVLAVFRPDKDVHDELGDIESSPDDDKYPTVEAGVIHADWCRQRRLGTAHLLGEYVDVTHSRSISALRPRFLARALSFGHHDFDAAAIKRAEPRLFTKEISRYLYGVLLPSNGLPAGILFRSRHGDELELWAVFERSAGRAITDTDEQSIAPDDSALHVALRLHKLRFADTGRGK